MGAGQASCLIGGSSVIHAQLTSPLTLLVAALLVAASLGGVLLSGRLLRSRSLSPRGAAALIIVTMAVGLVILVAMPYATVKSSLDYGAWLEGETLHVRFYGSDTVSFNVCKANFTVIERGRADSILKYRTYGTGDPLAGISMGYYKTVDGRRAYVVIVGKDVDRVLLVDNGSSVALVGVASGDCIQSLYQAILQARQDACR